MSQPAFVSFSHILGRKVLLLGAVCFFTAGCAIAGWANNFSALLAGRTVQGIGGGGIAALTSVLLTDLFTLRERGKWAGLINIVWAIGTVSGPVLGGALCEKGAWVSINLLVIAMLKLRTNSHDTKKIVLTAVDLLDKPSILRTCTADYFVLFNPSTSSGNDTF